MSGVKSIIETLSASKRATLLFGPGGKETALVSTVDDNGRVTTYGLQHAEFGALMAEVGGLLNQRTTGSIVIGGHGGLTAQTTSPGTPPIGGPHGMPPWFIHLLESMHQAVLASVGVVDQQVKTR